MNFFKKRPWRTKQTKQMKMKSLPYFRGKPMHISIADEQPDGFIQVIQEHYLKFKQWTRFQPTEHYWM